METCGKASALSWEICGRILVKTFFLCLLSVRDSDNCRSFKCREEGFLRTLIFLLFIESKITTVLFVFNG